jgi:hypothetical protein
VRSIIKFLACLALVMAAAGISAQPQPKVEKRVVPDNYVQPIPIDPYPALFNPATVSRWLVIKCQLLGVPGTGTLPRGFPPGIPNFDTLISKFLTAAGTGTGNLTDYYRDVTYNRLSLSVSVVGWYHARVTRAVTTYAQRTALVEDCANAIPTLDLPDSAFDSLDGIIAVVNGQISAGAGNVGKTSLNIRGNTYTLGAVAFDSASLYTAFAAHEVGHGLSLQHSRNSAGVDYGDPYDLMSAFSTYQFSNRNYPAEGGDLPNAGGGPGLNVPNLMVLGAIPPERLGVYSPSSGQTHSYTLTALSHARNHDSLGVEILWTVPIPGLPNVVVSQIGYTVEYRQNDAQDAGLPGPVVLVHRVHAENTTYPWLNDLDAVLSVGQSFQAGLPPNLNFRHAFDFCYVTVDSVDPKHGTAVIHISTTPPPGPPGPPPR